MSTILCKFVKVHKIRANEESSSSVSAKGCAFWSQRPYIGFRNNRGRAVPFMSDSRKPRRPLVAERRTPTARKKPRGRTASKSRPSTRKAANADQRAGQPAHALCPVCALAFWWRITWRVGAVAWRSLWSSERWLHLDDPARCVGLAGWAGTGIGDAAGSRTERSLPGAGTNSAALSQRIPSLSASQACCHRNGRQALLPALRNKPPGRGERGQDQPERGARAA